MRSKVYMFLIGVLLLGFCLGRGVAVAGEVERPEKVISVSLLPLSQGWINYQEEKIFKSDTSTTSEWRFLWKDGTIGLGYTVGTRKYTKPIAPEGFWLGISFGCIFVGEIKTYYLPVPPVPPVAVKFGGNLGYKFLLSRNFTIEPYLGVEYITGYNVASAFSTLYGLSIGFGF